MDIAELLSQLNEENIQPVYLVHGPERFFIDELVRRLKEIVLAGPMADFNLHEIKAGEATGAEIVSRVRQVPMMSSKSLVVVENAHKWTATDMEALDPYLADPVPETCLVAIGDRFDARRSFFRRARERGQLFMAEPLREQGIAPFLKSRASVRGVRMSKRATAAIAAAVGPDCAALDDAVERLGLYAGPGREVNEEDVAEVVTAVRQHSVFELVDAIGNGRTDKALALLEGLLSRREEPIMINAMVARHFRQLLKTRIHLHLGTDQKDLAGLVGAPHFVVKKLVAQARRFKGATLESALGRLARADYELKSARRPSSMVIEEAVIDLCPPR